MKASSSSTVPDAAVPATAPDAPGPAADWRVPVHGPGEFDGDPLAERYFLRYEREYPLHDHQNTPVPYPTCAKAKPLVPHHLNGFEEIDMNWRPPPVPQVPVCEAVVEKLEAVQIPYGASFRLVPRLKYLTEMSLTSACHGEVVRPL